MKVSSINFSFFKNNKKVKNTPNFGNVYIEDTCDLRSLKNGIPTRAEFTTKDALLLNSVAKDYPYQDCFIRTGFQGLPYLEYRETPVRVQTFTKNLADSYDINIDPEDTEYPSESLILYKDSPLSKFIGVPSIVSLNPSLPYTVKAGYELHKKMLEKKFQIMNVVGDNDDVYFGNETLNEKAHKLIEDTEISLIRFLMESAYAAIRDKAKAEQIYASNYPKVQSRIQDERELELTKGHAELYDLKAKNLANRDVTQERDICKMACENYPNTEHNKQRIAAIVNALVNSTNYSG